MNKDYLAPFAALVALVIMMINSSSSFTALFRDYLPAQVGGGTACVEPLDDLIHWWDADRVTGTTAHDIEGAVDGTMSGVTVINDGRVGKAFRFPGNDLNQNGQHIDRTGGFIRLPQNFLTYPTSGEGDTPFTFELWFRTNGDGVIFGQQSAKPWDNHGNWVPGIMVGTDGDIGAEMFWDGQRPIFAGRTIRDNQWHHLAVTFDGTNEIMYIDGSVAGSLTKRQQAHSGGRYQYQWGTGASANRKGGIGGWHSYRGDLDEMSIYNRALAADEIRAIFNAGSGGKCKLECGNNILQQGEVCDGNDLDGQTCDSVVGAGHTGTLGCASDCQAFDTSGCDAPPPCSDGIDNDGDGAIDFPNDQGCSSADDTNESNPGCIDGIDNDGDGLIDHPADPGCTDPNDSDETDPPRPRPINISKNASPTLLIEPLLEDREFFQLNNTCGSCTLTATPDPDTRLGGTPEADDGFIMLVTLADTTDNSLSHTLIAVGEFEQHTRLFNEDDIEYSGLGDDPDSEYPPSILVDQDNDYYVKIRQGTQFENVKVSPLVLPSSASDPLLNSSITNYALIGEDSTGKGHIVMTEARHWLSVLLQDPNSNPADLYTLFQTGTDLPSCIQALQALPNSHRFVQRAADFQLMLDVLSICQR